MQQRIVQHVETALVDMEDILLHITLLPTHHRLILLLVLRLLHREVALVVGVVGLVGLLLVHP